MLMADNLDHPGSGVFRRELEAVEPGRRNPGQVTGVRNDVPGQSQCDVLVIQETVSVVPEVVFGVHGPVVEDGILAPLNDLVPEYNLIDLVGLGLVLGSQIKEELLHVPVEQGAQVGLQVKSEESQIVFLPGGRIVGNVFDNHLDRLDLGACPVVEEEGGQETDQRQPGEHRHGVRRQGVGAGQNGVHYWVKELRQQIMPPTWADISQSDEVHVG